MINRQSKSIELLFEKITELLNSLVDVHEAVSVKKTAIRKELLNSLVDVHEVVSVKKISSTPIRKSRLGSMMNTKSPMSVGKSENPVQLVTTGSGSRLQVGTYI